MRLVHFSSRKRPRRPRHMQVRFLRGYLLRLRGCGLFVMDGGTRNALALDVFFDFFRVPVLPDEVLKILGVTFRVSILFACLCLLTRPATTFSFVAGCYLFCMQNSFAKTHHMESLLLLVFCVLCFSRCGDGFSLDAWLRRAWRR